MLGKITTCLFFSIIFLFALAKTASAQCDSFGQNCVFPHRYIRVYTIDQDGRRWVEGQVGSTGVDSSPCTSGVNTIVPADGSTHVYTKSSKSGVNNVMEDGWARVLCSSDSGEPEYRGIHELQSYRTNSVPPSPRQYILQFHPPAGYNCENVVWQKRTSAEFDPSAPLEHEGYGCLIDANYNASDDYTYHIIVRMCQSNRPDCPKPPPCPSTYQSTCNAANNSVTFNWENVGAAEYAIRANAEPYDDWSSGPGDQYGMATSNSTTFFNIKLDTNYAWFVEPKRQLNTPNDPSRACFAGTFNCTSGPPPLPCPGTMNVSCNASGTQATFNWSLVPGANQYVLRADANPNSWANFAAGDGFNNVNSSSQTSASISNILPNTGYEWSIEPKRNVTDPNQYDKRCIIPFPISCNTIKNGLNLSAGTGAVSAARKGSGVISSEAIPPEIGQSWNNPVRATSYISTPGIFNIGLIGVAFTPTQNSCTEMSVPPAATSPTPPGIMRTLLTDDGITFGTNRGVFAFLPMNDVDNYNGKNFEFGKYYVYYNNTWYETAGTGGTGMPAKGTTLNIPNSISPDLTVRLFDYQTASSPFSASFDISFHRQMSSKLWYTRAYAVDPGGVGGFHETVGPCILPGDLREGSGTAADAIILP